MTPPSLREAPLTFRSSLAREHAERAHDTLNLLPYAEALANFISDCETPMSIGVQGDWGMGKTTLMNMLRGTEGMPGSGLLQDGKCQVVSIETWAYSQFHRGTALVIACFGALVDKLEKALLEAQTEQHAALADAVREARTCLVAAGATLQDGGAQGSEEGAPALRDVSAAMLRFRRAFAALVACWTESAPGRRVVVFVDDLDRAHPAETLLLLESFKNFVEIPGCVFVLAVDYDVVQRGMVERLGRDVQRTSGKAFYDKMIQLPFVMPTAAYRLENYIADLLDRTGFPHAEELAGDPQSREFLYRIALTTVGRNPRNLKRVVNTAGLLERIRERHSDGAFQPRDVQILFALICMQIAWPELFRHFVNDPTVDTVTSLHNWEFLDRLPDARRLFERERDAEAIKLNIGTFFDTLFSLLDANGDGQIDTAELAPVLEVMRLACMTAEGPRERPRDWFIRRVRENNADHDPLIDTFLEKVFMRSVWYLGSNCRYRKSGERYITLVHGNRQIGSLVSLRNAPFVFRLALSPEKVRSGLKAYWQSKKSMKSEAIALTRSRFGKEASMTGFGDTVVDYSNMTNMSSEDAVGLLNALYRIAIGDELNDWELEPEKKK